MAYSHRILPISLVWLALAGTLATPRLAAQDRVSPTDPGGDSAAEPTSPLAVRQDRLLEAEIRARLARAVIGADGFEVTVHGGVAYWSGTTTVAQHKGAATRMAHSAGAVRVVNNIRYRAAGQPASRQARSEDSDEDPPEPAPETGPARPRLVEVHWRDRHVR